MSRVPAGESSPSPQSWPSSCKDHRLPLEQPGSRSLLLVLITLGLHIHTLLLTIVDSKAPATYFLLVVPESLCWAPILHIWLMIKVPQKCSFISKRQDTSKWRKPTVKGWLEKNPTKQLGSCLQSHPCSSSAQWTFRVWFELLVFFSPRSPVLMSWYHQSAVPAGLHGWSSSWLSGWLNSALGTQNKFSVT